MAHLKIAARLGEGGMGEVYHAEDSQLEAASTRGGNLLWWGLTVVGFVWLVAVLCIDIDRPWTGSHDYTGAQWSQSARNNLRAGLGTTLGVPSSWHFGPLPIPAAGYYTHHPAGLPLLVTASFSLFGESEWAARLVPILSSLVGALALWVLARCCVGIRAAALGLLLLCTLPMQLYFGRMVNYEASTLMFVLAALICLWHWDRTARWGWLAVAFAALFAAMFTGWYAYVVVGTAGLLRMLAGRRQDHRLGAGLLLLTLVGMALFLVHIRLVRPDAWTNLLEAFVVRSGEAGHRSGGSFTSWDWLLRQGRFLGFFVLPGAWFLALAGTVLAVRRRAESEGLRWLGWATLYTGAATAAYTVVFRNGSYVHDFWAYYVVAPVAIMGGFALDRFLDWWKRVSPHSLLRHAGAVMVAAGLLFLGVQGYARTVSKHHYQYWILSRSADEPPDLIPALGRILEAHFAEDVHIIANLPHKGPHLRYYAHRPITYDQTDPAHWERQLERRGKRLGGLIWLGAAGSAELAASLPGGTVRQVEHGAQKFLLWVPTTAQGGAGPLPGRDPNAD